MERIKVELELTQTEWDVLKPLLEGKVLKKITNKEDEKRVCYDDIHKLKQGARVCNILKDGRWRFGGDYKSVDFVYELKSIDRMDFMRHRNAGVATWNCLKKYIESLC